MGLFRRRRAKVPDSAEILIFDTETADLPRNWRARPTDVDNWPRLVQAGWIVCGGDFKARRQYKALVQPDGFEISAGARRVHGITTEDCLRWGVDLKDVLRAFSAELGQCDLVVAHNLEFDEAIMTSEFIRAGLPIPFGDVSQFCTMKGTTAWCQIPPKRHGEYKWPKLSELHEICCGRPHDSAHDALGDCEAVLRCLRVLHRAGALQVRVVQRDD